MTLVLRRHGATSDSPSDNTLIQQISGIKLEEKGDLQQSSTAHNETHINDETTNSNDGTHSPSTPTHKKKLRVMFAEEPTIIETTPFVCELYEETQQHRPTSVSLTIPSAQNNNDEIINEILSSIQSPTSNSTISSPSPNGKKRSRYDARKEQQLKNMREKQLNEEEATSSAAAAAAVHPEGDSSSSDSEQKISKNSKETLTSMCQRQIFNSIGTTCSTSSFTSSEVPAASKCKNYSSSSVPEKQMPLDYQTLSPQQRRTSHRDALIRTSKEFMTAVKSATLQQRRNSSPELVRKKPNPTSSTPSETSASVITSSSPTPSSSFSRRQHSFSDLLSFCGKNLKMTLSTSTKTNSPNVNENVKSSNPFKSRSSKRAPFTKCDAMTTLLSC